jgi:hypothetical protein
MKLWSNRYRGWPSVMVKLVSGFVDHLKVLLNLIMSETRIDNLSALDVNLLESLGVSKRYRIRF